MLKPAAKIFLLLFFILMTSTGYSKKEKKKEYRGVATEERFIENIINKEIKNLNNDYYSSESKDKLKIKNKKNSFNEKSSKKETTPKKPFSSKSIAKTPSKKGKTDVDKILKNDVSQLLKMYKKGTNWNVFNSNSKEKLPSFTVKDLKDSKNSVDVEISDDTPGQGEMIQIQVSSPKQIIKCFGNVGGKKIYFLTDRKNHSFHGYAGFDIQEAPGKRKILIAVLFEDKSIKYLEKTIKVRKNSVTKLIPRYVYKKKKVKRTYYKKRRGKRRKYTKWVWIKVRKKIWVKPPTIHRRAGKKSMAQFQKELEDKLVESDMAMGGDEEDFDYVMPFTIVKSNEENKEKADQAKGRSLFKHQYKIKTPIQFWNGPFLQPTYPNKGDNISQFGKYRMFRFKGRIRRGYHRGLDIAKPTGTPLYAPNHGIVVITGYYGGRGNAVVVDHGGGIYTVHYHLSEINVEKGMFVRKGQLIGKVGSTGLSTGPHLHWEMRIHGVSVNTLDMRSPE